MFSPRVLETISLLDKEYSYPLIRELTNSTTFVNLNYPINYSSSNTLNYLGFCYGYGIGVAQDGKKAFELYSQSADMGNCVASCNLGKCYKNGIECVKDEKKAFELTLKAADMGNLDAIDVLGGYYRCGIGCNKDEKKAFELYSQAVDMGIKSANNLAYCYQNGIGCNKNEKKAVELYLQAVDTGCISSINNLAYCYQTGIGCDKDKQKAFDLYSRASDLGNVSATTNLAYCYRQGTGVVKDLKKSLQLYVNAYSKSKNATTLDEVKVTPECYDTILELNESIKITSLVDKIPNEYIIEYYRKQRDEIVSQKKLGIFNALSCKMLGFIYKRSDFKCNESE